MPPRAFSGVAASKPPSLPPLPPPTAAAPAALSLLSPEPRDACVYRSIHTNAYSLKLRAQLEGKHPYNIGFDTSG